MKKWLVRKADEQIVAEMTKNTDISRFAAELLTGRGITNTALAAEFFGEAPISEPTDIADMDKAVSVISEAAQNGDKILVYGDYDCDGVTSTVMLYSYLEAIGADVSWRIPTRDEGYGLNMKAVDDAAEDGVKLIITVDNGVSAVDEAEYIYEKGMKLVITDHHQVPPVLPRAEAVVNPHRRDDSSQYKDFAGCGVVLKLIMAMEDDIESVCEQYCELAAIGTVGDIVPLTGENRTIVSRGLDMMPYTENRGLLSLFETSGIDPEEMTSTTLAYSVCPRINAAGRYSTAAVAAELLLSDELASVNAEKLCEMNVMRQKLEAEIYEQALAQLREQPELLNRRVIVVAGEGWNHGIIGIVSARLLTKFGKPNIVISIEGDTARGSARSTEQLSMFDMLSSCGDLLIRFGGHVKAAGLSVETKNIEALKRRIYEYSEAQSEYPVEIMLADAEIRAEDLTIENIASLELFQPFGEKNPVPLFMLKNCVIKSVKALKEGKYVSFEFDYRGRIFRALHFGMKYEDFAYSVGTAVDMLANIDINVFREKETLCIKVKDIRLSGISQDKYFAAKQTYEDLRCGRAVDSRLVERIIPQLDDMKKVYDLLRTESRLEALTEKALAAQINYCKLRAVLDVLAEFGLAEINAVDGRVRLIPSGKKAELEKSVYLAELRKLCSK